MTHSRIGMEQSLHDPRMGYNAEAGLGVPRDYFATTRRKMS
jgi:hypothetical protein